MIKNSPERQAELLRQELKDWSNETVAISNQYFFKEPIKTYGVETALVRTIARAAVRQLKGWSKAEVFALCDLLFQSGYYEDATIAAELSYSRKKEFEHKDFKTFVRWHKRYINNWSSCDKFCNHTMGAFLIRYPIFLKQLTNWTKSKNRWLRRAAAVSLIAPARKGLFAETIFHIAGRLLSDEDHFIQKGYGWLLKEASKHQQQAVFDFVIANKLTMPRLSLRYAIEKLPRDLKLSAMSK